MASDETGDILNSPAARDEAAPNAARAVDDGFTTHTSPPAPVTRGTMSQRRAARLAAQRAWEEVRDALGEEGDAVRAWLAKPGSDPNIEVQTMPISSCQPAPLLEVAVSLYLEDSVAALVEAGANVRRPLTAANEGADVVYSACSLGQEEMLPVLLSARPPPDPRAATNDLVLALPGMGRTGAPGGRTALHAAAAEFGQRGKDEARTYIKMLLDAGYDPSAVDFANATPVDMWWLCRADVPRSGAAALEERFALAREVWGDLPAVRATEARLRAVAAGEKVDNPAEHGELAPRPIVKFALPETLRTMPMSAMPQPSRREPGAPGTATAASATPKAVDPARVPGNRVSRWLWKWRIAGERAAMRRYDAAQEVAKRTQSELLEELGYTTANPLAYKAPPSEAVLTHTAVELLARLRAAESPSCAEATTAALDAMSCVGDGVYAIDLLRPEFCRALCDELEAIEDFLVRRGHDVPRPNSMNRYGLSLTDSALAPMLDAMLAEVLRPISDALFTRDAEGGEGASDAGAGGAGGAGSAERQAAHAEPLCALTHHHSFSIRYREGEDRALATHVDASKCTLNVCLGREFSGAELYFHRLLRAVRSGGGRAGPPPDAAQPERFFGKQHPNGACDLCTVRYNHAPGVALVHLGSLVHGACPITSGTRVNLVMWGR